MCHPSIHFSLHGRGVILNEAHLGVVKDLAHFYSQLPFFGVVKDPDKIQIKGRAKAHIDVVFPDPRLKPGVTKSSGCTGWNFNPSLLPRQKCVN